LALKVTKPSRGGEMMKKKSTTEAGNFENPINGQALINGEGRQICVIQ
jgi:hypothetical protein